MKPAYNLCDCCGQPTILEPFVFYVGHSFDLQAPLAYPGPMYESFDLCESDAAIILRMLCDCTGPAYPTAEIQATTQTIYKRIKAMQTLHQKGKS